MGINGLTDLLKAFDCLLHDLLIANFVGYGFYHHLLLLIVSYLSNRKQRTKVNNVYSAFSDIMFKALLASILGPLLFDISECDIANNTDDNTPYTSNFSLDTVIKKLE